MVFCGRDLVVRGTSPLSPVPVGLQYIGNAAIKDGLNNSSSSVLQAFDSSLDGILPPAQA